MTNDLDVYTFELEIIAYELNATPPPAREHAQKRQARAQEILQIVDRIFTEAIPLMEKGSEDPQNDLADRLSVAKLIGSLRALETGTRAFMDTAMRGINGAVEGKGAEARRAMSEMENFQDLDPVFTEIREKTAALTAMSLQETEQNIQNVIRANLILFATAGVLGLLVFMVITGRLQTAFRRLTAAFHKTAEGEPSDPLPVTSQDEIGDLTTSFNQMVEQLKSKEKLREAFGQFLDPRIVANVVDAKTGQLKEVAERRKVTIFFSDISNFSGIGEQLTAANLVDLLNRYFTAATEGIRGRLLNVVGESIDGLKTLDSANGRAIHAKAPTDETIVTGKQIGRAHV